MAVTHVNLDVTHGNNDFLRKTRIADGIGVSVNGVDRSNHPELIQDFFPADITGVKNQADSLERFVHRGA